MTDRLAEIRDVDAARARIAEIIEAARLVEIDLGARLAACERVRDERGIRMDEIQERAEAAEARLAACDQVIAIAADFVVSEEGAQVRLGTRWYALADALAKYPDSDPDYTPAYQDEYQRLWHRTAARLAACEQKRERLLRAVGGPRWEQAQARLAAAEEVLRQIMEVHRLVDADQIARAYFAANTETPK